MSRLLLLATSLLPFGFALNAGTVEPLKFLENRVAKDPEDFIAWNQIAARRLQLFREKGNLADLSAASHATVQSLKAVPASENPGGLTAQVRVDLAGHRFGAAWVKAEQLRQLQPAKQLPLLLLSDALLELGEYDSAAKLIFELVAEHGDGVDSESRKARLALVRGENDPAMEHLTAALEYAKALGIPSPETVAWCHVQIGELRFRHGEWDAAAEHYDAALGALPGYWAAQDHVAELRGAQGRIDEAVALYEQILAQTPRPELQQALGDLYLFARREAEARVWHERALAGYMASIEQGHVLYYHHLSGFFTDSQSDPKQAIAWARKDLELRKGIAAHDALAWALYQDGQISQAAEAIERALATGAKDPHVLYHAGMIRMSAGDLKGGKAALQQALQINPRTHTFHVHR